MSEENLKGCPICNGKMKIMYKPDSQLHCRGVCGLILRVQNTDFESKLSSIINTRQSPESKKIEEALGSNQSQLVEAYKKGRADEAKDKPLLDAFSRDMGSVEGVDINHLQSKVNELREYIEGGKSKNQAILGYCDYFDTICERYMVLVQPPKSEPVDLENLVEKIVQIMHNEAEDGLIVHVDDYESGYYVTSDDSYIEQDNYKETATVIANLLFYQSPHQTKE